MSMVSETGGRRSWPVRLNASDLVDAGERFGLVFLLGGVIVMFSLLPASDELFLTQTNLNVVLGNVSVVSILAIAGVFPLVVGQFDFTIGAVAGLSSIVTAAAMSNFDASLPLAIMLGIAVGAAVGIFNGVLVAGWGLNAFIVTIGGATLLPGIVTWYTEGVDIVTGIDPRLGDFGSLNVFGLPRPAYMVFIIALGSWFLLRRTVLGRQMHAVGSNAAAARLVGVPTRRAVFLSFVISGTLAGVAGVLLTARNGGGVVGSGVDLLFPALAAVFLGATAIDPGRYNVWGALLGTLFVAVSVSGLTLSGAAAWVPSVFNGGALIIAVALSTVMSRRRRT